MSNAELDHMISRALGASETLIVEDSLVEKTIRKIEKRALLRELLFELSFKIMVALGSIGILSGVMIWFNGLEMINRIFNVIGTYRHLVIMLFSSAFAIIFIDQVILKYFHAWENRNMLHEQAMD
jgi:hypothetical protein